jgi:hypothetical protein
MSCSLLARAVSLSNEKLVTGRQRDGDEDESMTARLQPDAN